VVGASHNPTSWFQRRRKWGAWAPKPHVTLLTTYEVGMGRHGALEPYVTPMGTKGGIGSDVDSHEFHTP